MYESSSVGPDLVELTREECLNLLENQVVGRLGVNRVDDGPLVVPVNFVLAGDEIIFRTAPGTKLTLSLSGGADVSFQVDWMEPSRHTAWSVLVTGPAYKATHWDIDRQGLEAWAGGAKDHWVRIVIRTVSGRWMAPTELVAMGSEGYL